MISIKKGKVIKIMKKYKDITMVEVIIDNKINKAINYNDITGHVEVENDVIINTTAVELNLGTGGYHFIIAILDKFKKNLSNNNGHIMKMRYTPHQVRCLTLEENEKFKDIFNGSISLNEGIYAVGELHSMLEPLVTSIKYIKPNTKICYIMTDGGSLPISFSNTVRRLKENYLLDKTITIGNSFGGDYECVNIYSAIIASKKIINADVTIIAMGPGIVGTNTKYGFSGIEQGYILDGIKKLKGNAIFIPRISFNENRSRHIGLSHHNLTVLSDIVNNKVNVIIPKLKKEKNDIIERQLISNYIYDKHDVYHSFGENIKKAFEFYDINPTSMGKNFYENKEYFIGIGAVGNFICSNYL
ncbi:DUF3866 family protein [Anaeromonas gelatinilytica]|uniref:DUF3866 family protein n=1 Tax=Anaeromonas gelatinilytica TaxID=2683194 RepID=UPI00207916C3|nr:DUF3866 family protein [Anaeromonas gelatinilytica]